MDPIIGAALIGSSAALGGSAITAGLASSEAHKQRAFLRNMRKNAYQVTMKDMEKAGLNPILAYRTGPTPLGGSPSIPQIPDFGSSAARGAQAGAAAGGAKSQASLRKKQEDLVVAQGALTSASEREILAKAKKAELEYLFEGMTFGERIEMVRNQRDVGRGDAAAGRVKHGILADPTFGTPAWTARTLGPVALGAAGLMFPGFRGARGLWNAGSRAVSRRGGAAAVLGAAGAKAKDLQGRLKLKDRRGGKLPPRKKGEKTSQYRRRLVRDYGVDFTRSGK